MVHRILTVCAASSILSLGACAADRAGGADPAWGLRIATANCARCHAVGPSGGSPNAFAPPFRQLRKLYALDALDATFTPHALIGHAPMPSFAAQGGDMEDLLAYIRSLQEPGSPAWPRTGR